MSPLCSHCLCLSDQVLSPCTPQPQEAKAHRKGAWSPLASVSSTSQGTPALASDTCSAALPSTSSVGPELENEVPEVGEATPKHLGLEAQQQS